MIKNLQTECQSDFTVTTTLNLQGTKDKNGSEDGKSSNTDQTLRSQLRSVSPTQLKAQTTKADDEVTTTLKFVDKDTGNVIYTEDLKGSKDETIYEALGNKTIYDRILEDYPEYLSWDQTKYDNAIDSRGDFKNTSDGAEAKAIYDKWNPEYKTGTQHQLFDYRPISNASEDLTNEDPYVQLLAGKPKLGDQATQTIKLEKNANHIVVIPVYSKIQRPITYWKYPNIGDSSNTDNKPVYVDKDANAYSVTQNNNPGTISNYMLLAEGQQRKIASEFLVRDYNRSSSVTAGKPKGNNDLNGTAVAIEYPEETTENRKLAEKKGNLAGWSTLDELVKGIDAPKYDDNIGYLTNGYTVALDSKIYYYDENGNNTESTGPKEAKVVYYQNQSYHIDFEDISEINPQDISGYDYSPTDMTLTANSKTNPHNGDVYNATNGATNNNVKAYNVDSDGKYSEIIKQLKDQGYVIVSSDVNTADQYYDVNNLQYNADGTIKRIDYHVKVKHAVKKITPDTTEKITDKDGNVTVDPSDLTKTATRTIHYVENDNADPSQATVLQIPTDQEVKYTGSIYIDAVTNKTTTPVEATDKDGKSVQVASDKAGTITWTADDNKDSFAKVSQDIITKAGETWKVVKSTKATGTGYTDYTGNDAKTAPEEAVYSSVANNSHEDVYLIYHTPSGGGDGTTTVPGGDTPTTNPGDDKPDKSDKPDQPNNPEKPDKPNQPEQPADKPGQKNTETNKPTISGKHTAKPGVVAGHHAVAASAAKTKSSALPQTGASENTAGIFGLLATLTGLFGLTAADKKKRR
jgi:LPXTG-motif cell wall-anchored protein